MAVLVGSVVVAVILRNYLGVVIGTWHILGRMAEKENILFYHCTLHGTLSVGCSFSFILAVRNVCVDKMDYWFRECAVTGVIAVTAVTIRVGVTNPLAGNMVCIKCLETSQLVNLHR